MSWWAWFLTGAGAVTVAAILFRLVLRLSLYPKESPRWRGFSR